MCWTNLPFLISGLVVKDNKSGNLFFEHLPYYQKNYTCWKARHWQRNIVAQHSWEIYHWLVSYNFSSIQGIYIYIYMYMCNCILCILCTYVLKCATFYFALSFKEALLLTLPSGSWTILSIQTKYASPFTKRFQVFHMFHNSPNVFMCFIFQILFRVAIAPVLSNRLMRWGNRIIAHCGAHLDV